jgi:hypothetical protein
MLPHFAVIDKPLWCALERLQLRMRRGRLSLAQDFVLLALGAYS